MMFKISVKNMLWLIYRSLPSLVLEHLISHRPTQMNSSGLAALQSNLARTILEP